MTRRANEGPVVPPGSRSHKPWVMHAGLLCALPGSACAFLIMRDRLSRSNLASIGAAVLVAGLASRPAFAQAANPPRAEVSAGWSLLPANGDDFPRPDSHGIVLGAAGHFTSWFGLAAELGLFRGTARALGPGFEGLVARTTVRQYLVGPRFTRRGDVADVFAHGFVGRSTGDAGPDFGGFSDSGFTFAGGAGVDVHATRRLSVRVQYDLLGSFADIVEGNSRFSVAGVLRY